MLKDFTLNHNNIKFLLGHHNNPETRHLKWTRCNGFTNGVSHVESGSHLFTSSMQYEVIENGEMNTITKKEKNRIFYSPDNRIQHNTIKPQDVLKYIDGDYTFLDKDGNSKGKIRNVIGNKNEDEYTFDHLANDIINTYEKTNKIRFWKRGYFKPFYDAIKKNYNTETKQITNELIQNFHDIEDTIKCTCS